MVNRDFNTWMSNFRDSISDYGYYVDFEKVYRNVDSIREELNILNSLIGSKNIEKDFENLLRAYPKILKCIPMLLGVRKKEIYCQDENGGHYYKFDYGKYFPNSHVYYRMNKYFMRKTGLFELLENGMVNDLVDYVTGIEIGLNSNARKNRGGDLMEDLVESFIQKAGFIKDINYFKEMNVFQIENKWNIDLSSITNYGKTKKRFDFVVKTENMIYAIETSFYNMIGGKLNETARSYKNIALEAKEVNGFSFVWITDGNGWNNARNNLEETFDVMQHIYNINDLENGIFNDVFM